MSKFVVDADVIDGAHVAVRNTASRVQSEVAAMHSQLIGLQDTWSGSASVAFQGVLQDWRATQVRVEESLANITEALGLAARQYNDVESANTRMFAG